MTVRDDIHELIEQFLSMRDEYDLLADRVDSLSERVDDIEEENMPTKIKTTKDHPLS